MRIYKNAYQLLSEIFRDLDEMGIIVKPKSYQNKKIEGLEEYETKEIMGYSYMLTDLPDPEVLFLFEGNTAKRWALEEFKERIMDKGFVNPGKAWKIREKTWLPFLTDDGEFDYTYNGRLHWNHNVLRIITELKRNPDTRQAWLPIFHPQDLHHLGGKKRIPCSLGYFFMVREGVLHLTYIQRSADAVAHFGNDIYLAWLMKEYIASKTGFKAGDLRHTIFSLHAYRKDWGTLEKGISNLK